jgi:hypothetical protein
MYTKNHGFKAVLAEIPRISPGSREPRGISVAGVMKILEDTTRVKYKYTGSAPRISKQDVLSRAATVQHQLGYELTPTDIAYIRWNMYYDYVCDRVELDTSQLMKGEEDPFVVTRKGETVESRIARKRAYIDRLEMKISLQENLAKRHKERVEKMKQEASESLRSELKLRLKAKEIAEKRLLDQHAEHVMQQKKQEELIRKASMELQAMKRGKSIITEYESDYSGSTTYEGESSMVSESTVIGLPKPREISGEIDLKSLEEVCLNAEKQQAQKLRKDWKSKEKLVTGFVT